MLKAKDYNIFSKYLYMKLIFLLKMLLQNIYNQMTAFFQSNLPISSKKLLDPFLRKLNPSHQKKKQKKTFYFYSDIPQNLRRTFWHIFTFGAASKDILIT